MKFKSEYITVLVLIFILFSITAVSASENQNITIDGTQDANLMKENQIDNNYNDSKLKFQNSENPIIQENNESIENDEYSFKELYNEINKTDEVLNLKHDYRFNKSCDWNLSGKMLNEMDVKKDKLTINGFNHVIDGAGTGAPITFNNTKGEIIINDLTFKNYNSTALSVIGNATLNNVCFTNCTQDMGIITAFYGSLTLNNCSFYKNTDIRLITTVYSNININGSVFSGHDDCVAIDANRGQLHITNSIFENFPSNKIHMINYKGDSFELINSRFANSNSDTSGGAILAKYIPVNNGTNTNRSYIASEPILIENCIFENLTCANDGGAIHIDLDSASNNVPKTMNIKGTNFTDCSSRFGGAISILGGNLNISECNFIKNNASFKGGAICSSWTNISIEKSNFENNIATKNGGAISFDKNRLIISESNFKANKVLEESNTSANAIYAYDVEAYFSNSTFDNGGVAVYADFASNSKIENVEKNSDIFLMDNHNYIVSVESKGIKLNLTGNEITVDTLPSRFDARDWGWTTQGKFQGDNDDCWAFATVASIETALGKSTGTLYNLSQNYVQKLQLKYYPVGDLRNSLTGFSYSGLGYALSWYGVLPADNPYDDRGMISDTDMNTERIHVQDAMFIYTGMNDTIDSIKRAVLKYGAVTVQYWAMAPRGTIPTEGEDIAIMEHDTHFVSIVGWDDTYKDEFDNTTGLWIVKDSLVGFDNAGYTNFPNVDYYAIDPQRAAIAYIFENDIDYHVNYQTDLTGLAGFDKNYNTYSNEFTSKYDELIGAVGTYFNESGINYSFDIFLNGKKVHTQTGISEFPGFRTIILNKYIPVKTGDSFKVVFKSNAVPYQAWSRVHYMNGTSLVSKDNTNWIDFAPLNKTVCLKVYTVADDTKISGNKNIAVDYAGGSYFSVKVITADGRTVGAGESVKFTINGKSTIVKTNSNGIAKVKITQLPGKHTIKTTYKGKTYKNTVNVKQVLKATKVSVKKTAKKFTLKATLKINGKAVKGKVIKFKLNGKVYKAKTSKKGIATVTMKKSVIKSLKKGKTYSVKVSYGKDTIKTTVKVK